VRGDHWYWEDFMTKQAVRARVLGVRVGSDGPQVTLGVDSQALEVLQQYFGTEVVLEVTPVRPRLVEGARVIWTGPGGYQDGKVASGPLLVNGALRWQVTTSTGTHWANDSDLARK
jgi:hypothetical protein